MSELNQRVVPYTAMVRYFRDLPTSRKERRQRAEELAGDPTPLAELLESSVNEFASYENDESFYPAERIFTGDVGGELRRTIDVARRIASGAVCEVPEDHALDFVYVNRELVPARTTGGGTFTPGGRPRLDLLLMNAHDRTPIIGEIKIGTDRDAFYAFVQLLALASQLLTDTQRARLREWGGVGGASADFAACPVVDLYTFAVDRPSGTHLRELHAATQTIASKLIAMRQFSALVRRIAYLDASGEDEGLRMSRVYCYPLTPLER